MNSITNIIVKENDIITIRTVSGEIYTGQLSRYEEKEIGFKWAVSSNGYIYTFFTIYRKDMMNIQLISQDNFVQCPQFNIEEYFDAQNESELNSLENQSIEQ